MACDHCGKVISWNCYNVYPLYFLLLYFKSKSCRRITQRMLKSYKVTSLTKVSNLHRKHTHAELWWCGDAGLHQVPGEIRLEFQPRNQARIHGSWFGVLQEQSIGRGLSWNEVVRAGTSADQELPTLSHIQDKTYRQKSYKIKKVQSIIIILYYARWQHTVTLETVQYKTSTRSRSQEHYTVHSKAGKKLLIEFIMVTQAEVTAHFCTANMWSYQKYTLQVTLRRKTKQVITDKAVRCVPSKLLFSYRCLNMRLAVQGHSRSSTFAELDSPYVISY